MTDSGGGSGDTGSGGAGKRGLSAYSVFNRDCKQLDGQLTGEQFEREMRFGAGSVR